MRGKLGFIVILFCSTTVPYFQWYITWQELHETNDCCFSYCSGIIAESHYDSGRNMVTSVNICAML
jgi:hypothetical protein